MTTISKDPKENSKWKKFINIMQSDEFFAMTKKMNTELDRLEKIPKLRPIRKWNFASLWNMKQNLRINKNA